MKRFSGLEWTNQQLSELLLKIRSTRDENLKIGKSKLLRPKQRYSYSLALYRKYVLLFKQVNSVYFYNLNITYFFCYFGNITNIFFSCLMKRVLAHFEHIYINANLQVPCQFPQMFSRH